MPVAAPPTVPLARRRVACALAWSLTGAPMAAPRISDVEQAEYRIKAAFLCKFGNYVEWPGGPPGGAGPSFGIGLLAPPQVVDELHAAARVQAVLGLPIAVHTLGRGAVDDALAIVFVARSHAGELAAVLAAIGQRPVLVVTESVPGRPAPPGSMINFVVEDDKVRFDIALAPAQARGLKISARLLGVARHVSGGPS